MSESQTMSADELAQRALGRMIADLIDRVHDAIEDGLDTDALHSIVGLWEANNLNEHLTYQDLVEAGTPTCCDDCACDVTPHDEYGHSVEGGWEWYMVRPEIWKAASLNGVLPSILCIGCLAQRIERPLSPQDFSDFPVNQPNWLYTKRLNDLLERRAAEERQAGDELPE